MTALLAFLLTHTSIALAALGALATVLGIGWGNLRGAKRERDKQAGKDLAAATEGQKIDDAVAGRAPDDNRERLGRWSKQ
ncbi:hypothetical protein LB521_09250 [Mesorhizobium sp. BR-1-1-8]|uniref:hypothetical protein n=1 Tax=unclassified Mesorhizobium TaxID=325217 RepID=UPI001129B03E|nr:MULTISPECIES: hypothetical protein [unclassified Mesorhizobium]MBZ9981344.1 hypothetical protein [Mesorhizobium sp. BR-1-1-8]TPL33734.1 hypothetical protein FJ947_19285 [Mesorhizobium sp. B2-4-8]